ncbi:twin-arginine translocase TatA/TatE family subunit [Streptomyces sp. UH6]|uniref:twin-arginine translocase TatA/TatE family subunit n=1 Tax=Streptomyces sp. UH6 TaxID=2748379 RepID=UPI0015D4A072|nr:twin-arginine translocase TatA/TatE family subunit [Streptomyces sp. UH6]NYV75285.1 twin-arginine translocase TatA/TatE family subunit [Streptomyces sp. UH6]
MFGLSELAVVLLVVAAVLAAKRLPELTRSMGKSARILKAESRALKDEPAPGEPRVVQGEAGARDAAGRPGPGGAAGA